MSLRDEMDIMTIRDERRDQLRVSRDTGDNDAPIAVLLHIPDMEKSDHSHIELNLDQCVVLRDWLNRFLKEHGR